MTGGFFGGFRWAKPRRLEEDTTGLILRERLGDALKIIRYTQIDSSEFFNGPVAVNIAKYSQMKSTEQSYWKNYAH